MKCHPVGHMSPDISWIKEQMDEERGPAVSFCTPLSFCLSLCLQASLSLPPLLCFFACFSFFLLFLFLTRTSQENCPHFLRGSRLSWPRQRWHNRFPINTREIRKLVPGWDLAGERGKNGAERRREKENVRQTPGLFTDRHLKSSGTEGVTPGPLPLWPCS